jgi:alpha-glucosidase (family GH31 glycosyl hydrolase)
MRYSIAALMNFNMFGIPHVGADVCGTFESDLEQEEQEEICGRWMQLATFYPFAR